MLVIRFDTCGKLIMLFMVESQQGNRSSSSACGSADVLEALGVAINLEPEVSSVVVLWFVSPLHAGLNAAFYSKQRYEFDDGLELSHSTIKSLIIFSMHFLSSGLDQELMILSYFYEE